jgi:hypothetical protein
VKVNRTQAIGALLLGAPGSAHLAALLEILPMTEPVGLPEFLRALQDFSVNSAVSFSRGLGSLNVSAPVYLSES